MEDIHRNQGFNNEKKSNKRMIILNDDQDTKAICITVVSGLTTVIASAESATARKSGGRARPSKMGFQTNCADWQDATRLSKSRTLDVNRYVYALFTKIVFYLPPFFTSLRRHQSRLCVIPSFPPLPLSDARGRCFSNGFCR